MGNARPPSRHGGFATGGGSYRSRACFPALISAGSQSLPCFILYLACRDAFNGRLLWRKRIGDTYYGGLYIENLAPLNLLPEARHSAHAVHPRPHEPELTPVETHGPPACDVNAA